MRTLKKELWPGKVTISEDEYHGKHYYIENWLGENFGQMKKRWIQVPQVNSVDYYFRSSKDATWFALKWAS